MDVDKRHAVARIGRFRQGDQDQRGGALNTLGGRLAQAGAPATERPPPLQGRPAEVGGGESPLGCAWWRGRGPGVGSWVIRVEMRWHELDGVRLPVAVWYPGTGWRMISNGVAGGGIGPRGWVLDAQVPVSYDQMDPGGHVGELAASLGLVGVGIGMLPHWPVQGDQSCWW